MPKGDRGLKMPDKILCHFWEWFSKYLPAMALAVFGAVVHALNDHADEWSWKRFLVGIGTACFIGLVMCYILEPMDVPDTSKSAAIAISGYLSNDVLRAILQKARRKIDLFRG